MEPVRLLVVEDSATLADALVFAFSFEEGVEVIGVAPTVRQALEMVASERPDVVIMDVRLPDGSGLDATSEVVTLQPGAAVIVTTAHGDNLTALEAADAGAAGFLLKDVRIAKLAAAVRHVRAEGLAVDPAVLAAMLADAKTGEPPEVDVPAAEHEVVELLAEGLDRQAIAARLGVEEIEVSKLAAAARGHLGARSNLEAVVRAARAGLLDPDQGSKARISNR